MSAERIVPPPFAAIGPGYASTHKSRFAAATAVAYARQGAVYARINQVLAADQATAVLKDRLTDSVVAFLTDPDHAVNASFLRTLIAAWENRDRDPSDLGYPLMIRMHVLTHLVPPGYPPTQKAGPDLELLIRFIEAANSLIDWDSVAARALTFHNEGGN